MAAGPFYPDMVWHVRVEDLLHRTVGDVDAVYNRASGDTHILNFLSKALLDCLSRSSMTIEHLAPSVLREIDMTADDCPASLIQSTLLELDDLGLVHLVKGQP